MALSKWDHEYLKGSKPKRWINQSNPVLKTRSTTENKTAEEQRWHQKRPNFSEVRKASRQWETKKGTQCWCKQPQILQLTTQKNHQIQGMNAYPRVENDWKWDLKQETAASVIHKTEKKPCRGENIWPHPTLRFDGQSWLALLHEAVSGKQQWWPKSLGSWHSHERLGFSYSAGTTVGTREGARGYELFHFFSLSASQISFFKIKDSKSVLKMAKK